MIAGSVILWGSMRTRVFASIGIALFFLPVLAFSAPLPTQANAREGEDGAFASFATNTKGVSNELSVYIGSRERTISSATSEPCFPVDTACMERAARLRTLPEEHGEVVRRASETLLLKRRGIEYIDRLEDVRSRIDSRIEKEERRAGPLRAARARSAQARRDLEDLRGELEGRATGLRAGDIATRLAETKRSLQIVVELLRTPTSPFTASTSSPSIATTTRQATP